MEKCLREVDVNAYLSTQQITKTLPFMKADEYRRRVQEGWPGAQDDGASTDWLDEVTRTPFTQIYNISLRGGSRTTNYVASFGIPWSERPDQTYKTTRCSTRVENHSSHVQ